MAVRSCKLQSKAESFIWYESHLLRLYFVTFKWYCYYIRGKLELTLKNPNDPCLPFKSPVDQIQNSLEVTGACQCQHQWSLGREEGKWQWYRNFKWISGPRHSLMRKGVTSSPPCFFGWWLHYLCFRVAILLFLLVGDFWRNNNKCWFCMFRVWFFRGVFFVFFSPFNAGCSVAVSVIKDKRTELWQDFTQSPTVSGDLLVNIIV